MVESSMRASMNPLIILILGCALGVILTTGYRYLKKYTKSNDYTKSAESTSATPKPSTTPAPDLSAGTFNWPDNQLAAVSLTYDDGVENHHKVVAPMLEQHNLRGTFYVTIVSDPLNDTEPWKQLAARGHELGNHTVFHPCKWNKNKSSWLPKYYDLNEYDERRFSEEIKVCNLILSLIDGRQHRSFGNTCCHISFGHGENETLMDDILRENFVAARGPYESKVADVRNGINLMQIGHYGADGRTFDELKPELEHAAAIGGWIVYMIHGVGKDSHSMFIETEEHQKLLAYLNENKDKFWTAPLADVAQYVKQNGKGY